MSRRRTRKACRSSKRAAQYEHARRRAMNRFGLKLTKQIHNEIVSKIYLNGSTLVEKQSNRISVHDVEVGDETYRVVYDCVRKVLVTFLYHEEDEWPTNSTKETPSQPPSLISEFGCEPT